MTNPIDWDGKLVLEENQEHCLTIIFTDLVNINDPTGDRFVVFRDLAGEARQAHYMTDGLAIGPGNWPRITNPPKVEWEHYCAWGKDKKIPTGATESAFIARRWRDQGIYVTHHGTRNGVPFCEVVE